jgi:nucleotide-binding universal stress UspA family protein
VKDDVAFLASLFSFGVLAAFTAAQLAVIKLRFSEPDLPRPYRAPANVRLRGVEVPLPAIVGSIATFAIWIAAMGTHAGARYGGPAWLVAGLVVYVLVRRGRGESMLAHVSAPSEELPESQFTSILVPMKLGAIGEEMIATAVRLAHDRGALVEALYVIRVPLDEPLGSAPRWRRQSRFFSPTVEFVLRKAPCEVLVVAFPEGVMEEDGGDGAVS